MRTLYESIMQSRSEDYKIEESILDSDEKIEKNIKEKSSDVGRVMRLLVDCFYKKFSFDVGIRILDSRDYTISEDTMFGINYNTYATYHELFRYKLEKSGFKIIPKYDKENTKQFLIKFKGPKGGKITMTFSAFADYTYVDVQASESNKQTLIKLFNKYIK